MDNLLQQETVTQKMWVLLSKEYQDVHNLGRLEGRGQRRRGGRDGIGGDAEWIRQKSYPKSRTVALF